MYIFPTKATVVFIIFFFFFIEKYKFYILVEYIGLKSTNEICDLRFHDRLKKKKSKIVIYKLLFPLENDVPYIKKRRCSA